MLIVEKSNAFTNQYLGILLILAFTPNSIEVLSLSIFTFNARHHQPQTAVSQCPGAIN